VASGLGDCRGLRLSDLGTAGVRLVSTHLRCAQSVLDGGWWPRTRDVSKELPALLTAVGSRFGVVVARVSLSATVWDATASRSALVTGSCSGVVPGTGGSHDPAARRLLLACGSVAIPQMPPGRALALVAAGDGVGALRALSGGAGGFIMRPVISFVVFMGSGER